MADTGRSRRTGANRATKARGALHQLEEQRRSGTKHAAAYEVKDEGAIYDVIDDDEYDKLVAKRRDEAGGFIVDDDGAGYMDIGEEDDWGAEAEAEDTAQDSHPSKKQKAGDGKKGPENGSKKATATAVPGAKERMQRMFTAASVRSRPAPRGDAAAPSSDALLDDILGDLGPGDSTGQPSRRPAPVSFARPTPASRVSAPPAAPKAAPGRTNGSTARFSAATVSRAVPRVHLSKSPPAAAVDTEDMYDYGDAGAVDYEPDEDDAVPETGVPNRSVEKEEDNSVEDADMVPPVDAIHIASTTPAPKALASRLRNEELGLPVGTPTDSAAQPEGNGIKTPWRTPPPTFSEVKTPATSIPASGWQDVCGPSSEGAMEMDDLTEAPAAEWVDDGSLPVDNEGALPFFFLDAHEEMHAPGVVYLFGKVPHEGQYLSCCAVVKGSMRNLFVVPRAAVLAPHRESIQAAVQEAAADPSAQGHLIKTLHEAFAPVKAEMHALLQDHGVSKVSMRPVKRNYAFEDRSVTPGEQWVLKIKYPGSAQALPAGLNGASFAAVFGAGQSQLEALMLKRKVMGPSWLLLKHPTRVDTQAQLSWCKLEVTLETPKNVFAPVNSDRASPPLVVAALNLKTQVTGAGNSSAIVAASVVYLNAVRIDAPTPKEQWNNGRDLHHFSIVRKLDGQPFPAGFDQAVAESNKSALGVRNGGAMVSAQASERALLSNLLARLRVLDADVYVGHNVSAFDLDVLLHRLQFNKVPQWSRIGRLKRTKFPNLTGGGHTFGGGAGAGALSTLAGRLLCDTYLSARESVKEVDYTLATLANSLLKQQRTELTTTDIPGKFETAAKLMGLVKHAESDAWLALGLSFHLNVLPMTRQLTSLCGFLWSRTLQGQRAQRIEMLLLHEFHSRKFLLPDRLSQRERERLAKRDAEEAGLDPLPEQAAAPGKRNKPQYAGGLVLEPKKGLYEKYVLLLDFNSLYPSIIQEYNICFTTIQRTEDGSPAPLPESGGPQAVLPKVIAELVQRRRQVKGFMASERDPIKLQQYDMRQLALKLTANSMYGCLGFTHSRFYAKPLAELITAQGREILQSTVDLVQDTLGLEVIYGDTDSIMINTNTLVYDDVKKVGNAVKKEVNKRYKLLEIEMDGIYKCMLLLKKKKYAAIKIVESGPGPENRKEVQEQKGLDIVRRDWCPLSKDVGNFALSQILSGSPAEEVVLAIHTQLMEVRERVAAGAFPLNKFVITKQLTKRPEDYPDAKNQPHVQVALRRKAAGAQNGVMQGETVPYVICVEVGEDGQSVAGTASGKGLAQRAHHPDEIRGSGGKLALDVEYYLAQQVHPVVSRLCAPMDGTDPARLADCLGLDPSRFHSSAGASAADARDDAQFSGSAYFEDEDRFKGCEPLMLVSASGAQFKFMGVPELLKRAVAPESSLQPPDAIGAGEDEGLAPLSAAQLANQAALAARRHVGQYYDGYLQSDDELHPLQTRNVALRSGGSGSKPGTLPGDPALAGHMSRVVSESRLYAQLSFLHRILDVSGAARRAGSGTGGAEAERKLAGIREELDAGASAMDEIRNRCAYRWVDLRICT